MKIMLVDDDEIIRGGMNKIISDSGKNWEVIAEATDGEIALSMLEQYPQTDLIITDVRMPIMDGIALIHKVQELGLNVKMIVLSGYDDFNYVRNAFLGGAVDYLLKPFQKKDLIERIEKVERTIKESREAAESEKQDKGVIITDAMHRFMSGNREEYELAYEKLEKLGISNRFACYMAVAVMVDQYYQQYIDANQYEKRLESDVERIIHALNGNGNYSYAYCKQDQKMIFLVWADEESICMNVALCIYETIENQKEDAITVTVGLSTPHTDRLEVGTAIAESEEAVEARFYLGQNRMIQYSDIEGKCIELSYDLEPMVSQMVHALELCDYIKARMALDQIFLDISYCRPERFRKYMNNLLDLLGVRIRDFNNILRVEDPDYIYHIEYMNTYREMKTYMHNLLQKSVEYIQSEREKKSKKRIELAKAFIEQHYMEQIALSDVADYVELNASYFSNLFKQEVGMNFSEYLLNVRMEQAKKLLRDPKIKVYEIGNLVGYEDAVSFGRAFKKKYDMSPKEYRNSVY